MYELLGQALGKRNDGEAVVQEQLATLIDKIKELAIVGRKIDDGTTSLCCHVSHCLMKLALWGVLEFLVDKQVVSENFISSSLHGLRLCSQRVLCQGEEDSRELVLVKVLEVDSGLSEPVNEFARCGELELPVVASAEPIGQAVSVCDGLLDDTIALLVLDLVRPNKECHLQGIGTFLEKFRRIASISVKAISRA